MLRLDRAKVKSLTFIATIMVGTDLKDTGRIKPPRSILEGLYVFPPSRETLGGTSYLIVENTGNILIDSPLLDDYQDFLLEKGVRWLFLTHRSNHGKSVNRLQTLLDCEVIVQEQEAYLLPDSRLTPFQREVTIGEFCYGFWTPGHSPGSACLYWNRHGGVLFTGRHLLPSKTGPALPLYTSKTFHWYRQLNSVAAILNRFSPDTLARICPGANTGYLRGKDTVSAAYDHLEAVDLAGLRLSRPLL